MAVRRYWDQRARDATLDDIAVTHRDIWQRWLEIGVISRFLSGGQRAIDIGCGAGYGTLQYAPQVGEIIGIDASDDMVERANSRLAEVKVANAIFRKCDVLSLEPDSFGLFDIAISVRCLINLPDWESQKQAIGRISQLIRPGGVFLFVEGHANGRDGLNDMRRKMGLEEMPAVWHNVDFEAERTKEFVNKEYNIEEEIYFGTYDLISRVVHPLLVSPEHPKYDSKINEIAAKAVFLGDLSEHSDISRVMFLVLRRRN